MQYEYKSANKSFKSYGFIHLITFLCLLLAGNLARAQNITNYTFTASTGDFKSVAPVNIPISGNIDEGFFNNIPIGFDFWYLGSRYTTVSASTNGWLTLGSNISNAAPDNNLASGTQRPIIAPLWDDLSIVQSNASYATIGTAPDRIFIYRVLENKWNSNNNRPVVSFQVKLYETTGRIEFVYKAEVTAPNSPSASIGIGGSAGQFLSLTNTTSSPGVSSTAETTTLSAKPSANQSYSFISVTPTAASSLSFSEITTSGMKLNWLDNASNELGYVIYRSDDGGSTYSFISQTAANATSSVQSGLLLGTNYYWKVHAVTEGALSTALSGNQCTINSATISYPSSSYCSSSGMAPVTLTGKTGGTFSSGSGLSINPSTGEVNLTASTSGTYTVTYTSAPTGCTTFSTTANITVSTDGLWVGNVSSNWCSATNWCNGVIPGASTNIIIPTSAPFMPVLSCNTTINNLTLIGNGTLSLGSASLTINGSISGTGSFIGSASASLSIAGSSTAVSLKFSQVNQSSRSLKNYSQTRAASVTLTTPLDVYSLVSLSGSASTLISNGNLTLISSASDYAEIGSMTGTSSVSGDVNVQSFFTGNNLAINRGSRMISSPISDNRTNTVYQQLKSSLVITGPGGVGNGFDAGGWGNPNAPTLTTYSEPAVPYLSFVSEPSIFIRMTTGKASFLFYRGDRTNSAGNKVNAPYALPENVVVNYKGTINAGSLSVPILRSNNVGDDYNGMNALGNPYPSAIDWEKVYASNSSLVDNEIRMIKPGGGVATRKVIASYTAVTNADASTFQYIQPGQGFYIRKSEVGTSNFSFLESHKSVGNKASRMLAVPTSQLLATTPGNIERTSESNKIIRINIEQGNLKDETLLIFKEGLNAKFDNEDGIYLSGNTVLLGSFSEDNILTSINALPEVVDSTQIKLYVNATAGGKYNLNFSDISAADGFDILLKDQLFPDKVTEISSNQSYEFNVDRANPSSFGSNRFKIIFKKNIPFLTWNTFEGKEHKRMAQLKWRTSAENQTNYFEIERSSDGISFTAIGEVTASGTTTTFSEYSFIDKDPLTGTNYYRLKAINNIGSSLFSQIIIIKIENQLKAKSEKVVLYPNPAKDFASIEFEKDYDEVQVTISDSQGKIISTQKWVEIIAHSAKNIDLQQLYPGLYIVEVLDLTTNKPINRSKLMKN